MTAPRVYDAFLAEHLASHRQMAFVSGPRQVGKTTTCRLQADAYLNWDNIDDREAVLAGPRHLADTLHLDRLAEAPPVVLFDELHKFPRWQSFLKGFFDSYAGQVRIAVTGSGRLDVHRRGGDSLMGRYLSYRMHPFSVAETVAQALPPESDVIRPPAPVDDADFSALWQHGGFPEPFLKRNARFTRRWQSLRLVQLVREEIRDFTRIQQLDQTELLVRLLAARSGEQVVYDGIARRIRVSADTVRRWIAALSDLHLGFLVRPWFTNVTRSLRKEPKWYLRDWSNVNDVGKRAETFVGCHLAKAVDGWNDLGLGDFELGYLRDKEKREVDFVVIRSGRPWLLAEVKYRDESLSPHLRYYQDRLDAPFAFQVTVDAHHVERDCFAEPGRRPIVVPARTLLSQLL